MSRHVPRKDRWTRLGPNEYRSAVGRVYFRAGSWHAAFSYRIVDPDLLAPGEVQTWWASNFKRPRNAMIALEDKATELQRRHGEQLVIVADG